MYFVRNLLGNEVTLWVILYVVAGKVTEVKHAGPMRRSNVEVQPGGQPHSSNPEIEPQIVPCPFGSVRFDSFRFVSFWGTLNLLTVSSYTCLGPSSKSKILAEFQDFRPNSRFSAKSEIFAEIRDFRRNPRFSPKFEIFAEIPDFRRNPRFSPKFEIFTEIRDFLRNLKFSSKFKIFAEIRMQDAIFL